MSLSNEYKCNIVSFTGINDNQNYIGEVTSIQYRSSLALECTFLFAYSEMSTVAQGLKEAIETWLETSPK